ncbi:equilibrative nucleoside transporter 1 [Ctenocephalides felis]|uniref:equilibrative nucleoside transporter 1 n=1 Tax=Ctenocephalides felis TaxID=7515 RepID=UPI000E6E3654|nr:equilibrative nucleoside transporter 1 [Ctenocephalides felis]
MGQTNREKEEQALLTHSKPNQILSANDRTMEEGATQTTPFLVEPVRLTPAWEDSNLPNEELNFKGMTMERAQLETTEPRDRWKLVYLTLLLHGVGTLMPWNMFINAKEYFVSYKLSEEYTGITSMYVTSFLAYIGFAAQVPNILFNWLNVFVQIGGNLTTRIVWSLVIEIIIFLVTVGLAMTNSADWPGAFFWITMATVVILNMANGIYQNTVYGMAAKLPSKYTGAVILGSNISGTLTALIDIFSGYMAGSLRTSAIYYFITAMFILLLCFDTYFALPLNRFYRYHELKNEKESCSQNRGPKTRIPYLRIMRDAAPHLFSIFFVFFVTLAVFPTVHSDIKRVDENFPIDDMFVKITCFLTFNTCAMLGSFLTSFFQWPKPKYLIYVVTFRVIFIPLFLLCNYQPRKIVRTLPVLIANDWVYWIIAIAMGVSSGYLSSLGMMYAPRSVEPQYAVQAGMLGAAFLITGIFTGITFSIVFPSVVSSSIW